MLRLSRSLSLSLSHTHIPKEITNPPPKKKKNQTNKKTKKKSTEEVNKKTKKSSTEEVIVFHGPSTARVTRERKKQRRQEGEDKETSASCGMTNMSASELPSRAHRVNEPGASLAQSSRCSHRLGHRWTEFAFS